MANYKSGGPGKRSKNPTKKSNKRSIQAKTWLNKYTLAAIAFLVWLSFLDTNSLITQIKLSKTVSSLEKDKKMYQDQLQVALKEKENLEKNKEKYAREKYLFHKDNEEIIIIK